MALAPGRPISVCFAVSRVALALFGPVTFEGARYSQAGGLPRKLDALWRRYSAFRRSLKEAGRRQHALPVRLTWIFNAITPMGPAYCRQRAITDMRKYKTGATPRWFQ